MDFRHAEHLARKNMDSESRMEVIYRVLKDQLRGAKKELIQAKKDRTKEEKLRAETKRKILAAKERAKKDDNLLSSVKLGKREDGEQVFTLADNEVTSNMNPELKKIINGILHTESRKHYRFCPCCRKYEDDELSREQMGEFIEYVRQMHYKNQGYPKPLKK